MKLEIYFIYGILSVHSDWPKWGWSKGHSEAPTYRFWYMSCKTCWQASMSYLSIQEILVLDPLFQDGDLPVFGPQYRLLLLTLARHLWHSHKQIFNIYYTTTERISWNFLTKQGHKSIKMHASYQTCKVFFAYDDEHGVVYGAFEENIKFHKSSQEASADTNKK